MMTPYALRSNKTVQVRKGSGKRLLLGKRGCENNRAGLQTYLENACTIAGQRKSIYYPNLFHSEAKLISINAAAKNNVASALYSLARNGCPWNSRKIKMP